MARKKLFSEWPDLVMDLPLEPLRRVPGRQRRGGEGESRKMTKNTCPWSEGHVASDQAGCGHRSHIMHSLPCQLRILHIIIKDLIEGCTRGMILVDLYFSKVSGGNMKRIDR